MKTTEERLQELLDAKDAEIESARTELRDAEDRIAALERRIENYKGGWMLPDEEKDVPDLPLPRLEIRWFQMYETDDKDDWSEFRVVYSMVFRHLTNEVRSIPMGMTTVQSGGGKHRRPWEGQTPSEVNLPFRDGAHIHHDATHFRMPAFAVFPDGTFRRLDGDDGYAHQEGAGAKHRREPK